MSATVLRRAIAVLVGLVLLAALLALAARPTGSATPEAAVPDDARVSVRRDVDDVAVMLTVRRSDLSLVVAYRQSKGWFAAPADPVPRSAETSWTSTKGGGEVPALSAAYGRASAGNVRVTWSDQASDTVAVGTDGLWLTVRRGEATVALVERLAPNGSVLSEEPAL
jgi:hypothetical protein